MDIHERIDLIKALQTLTPKQRAVLYAWAVLGLTQREIAEALGVSERAVRYQIRTIRKQANYSLCQPS